ncbi:NAD-dependent epimerase/dehydratase family protein [Undibacterium sp. Ji67W]|uniref:NAD-dependent epimerase/dehydratase family protein n=1 Tax=Undibacterium sp. Ji67W TaxID=3413042 RepID=UPI003BF00759
MKVLITGGSGFIGSNLALKLLGEGHQVTVLDSLETQIHGTDPLQNSPLFLSIKGKVDFHHGSITDAALVAQCIEGQDAIVHLAAETGTGQSMYEIRRYVDVNIGGTALMLDILANTKHSVKKIVVASSRSIYGEGRYRKANGEIVYPGARLDKDLRAGHFDPLDPVTGEALQVMATDEESKIHPSSVYGITKQNQEQMVMTVSASLGIAASALRYQNVYGPGQSLSNPYTGILSIFSTRILNGKPINIFEDGLESRDFVFIDDVVDATKRALLMEEANGQIFGIGSGVATTVLDVAKKLIDKYGIKIDLGVTGEYRLGDIRHNYADLSKAKSLLGFVPQYDFDKGLDQFVKWVKEQEIATDKYEQSLQEMRAKGLMRG